jgi:hypothetical protein
MEQQTLTSARTSYRRAMAQTDDPDIKREFRRSVGLLDAIEASRGVTVDQAADD